MTLDLLSPHGAVESLRANYSHQLRQTINAYLPSFVFIGEALQNALDAVRVQEGGRKHISLKIDFEKRTVSVRDTGAGFPDQPDLLFLGGGRKRNLKLAGMVGVGLKVVLFSSDQFTIRARNSAKSLRVDVVDAYRFDSDDPPPIEIPDGDGLPRDPEAYFPEGTGTEIIYSFPKGDDDNEGMPERYLRDVYEQCIKATRPNFEKSLKNAVDNGHFENRLGALLASELRRYSYVGSTDDTGGLSGLNIEVRVIGSASSLGPLSEYADGKYEFGISVPTSYLTVRDTLSWATPPKPVIRQDELGPGGTNLTKRAMAINVTRYTGADEYRSLLVNARGNVVGEVDRYERLLFDKINSITITLGRIPQLSEYLPGGSRRVISARGVVTQHDIDISSGRNQQYVRCFDLIVDVDASLNYGKTHLTDTHLVANIRRFVNDIFTASVSNAAQNLVGKIKTEDSTQQVFWSREDLNVEELRQMKVPYDENDVIALFFELTGRGAFPEFIWYGLSSKDPYDGRAIVVAGSEEEQIRLRQNPRDTDLRVMEFKMRGASIARDFDREVKEVDKVNLVICYEVGESPIDTFQVVDITQSALYAEGRYIYPHVTHVLYDTHTSREVQLLPLREYVAQHFPPHSPAVLPAEVQDDDS